MIRTYEHDYAGWAEDTAKAIAEGRFHEIDLAALADEVASLSLKEKRQIESAMRVLLIHMLKAKYQPEKHTKSWDYTMTVQRRHIQKFLKASPSLKAKLDETLIDAYDDARLDASNETMIDLDTFPESCEWTLAEVLGH
jgi:hypothetical protein